MPAPISFADAVRILQEQSVSAMNELIPALDKLASAALEARDAKTRAMATRIVFARLDEMQDVYGRLSRTVIELGGIVREMCEAKP